MQDLSRQPIREPANLVCRRAVSLWTVEALIGMGVVFVAQAVWWSLDADNTAWQWVVAGLWLVLGGAYVLVMPRWRYRVHRWEATPEAIYTQRGWINQERRIAPVSRVQTVDLHRGPIAQAFRLASVTVTTASAAGPLRIEGLDIDEAHRLVDVLTAAAVTEQGDAT